MNTDINAKSAPGANAILARNYPAIEEGNDAFPNGNYQVQHSQVQHRFSSDKSRFLLTHSVTGARLVERLIAQKHARYACSLAAPRSAYRELQCSQDPTQEIAWNNTNFGEPPYFTPVIVCIREIFCTLDSEKDDVHPDWNGLEVIFPKGAWLAQGPVFNLGASGLQGLISIWSDESLKQGQFYTEAVDGDTFRFVVHCGPALYTFLQDKGHYSDKRKDIMTHVVTSCFSALQRKYKDSDGDSEEGWCSYKALESLANDLETKGCTNCNWEDPDFRPEEAATLLYPHDVPPPLRHEDE